MLQKCNILLFKLTLDWIILNLYGLQKGSPATTSWTQKIRMQWHKIYINC